MNEFTEVVGGLTVANLAVVIAAAVFLGRACAKAVKTITYWHDCFQKRDEELKAVIHHIDNCPVWRDKTLEAIKSIHSSIADLSDKVEKNAEEVARIQEKDLQRERNELRDRLLQLYRYFTSVEKNPMQAWSEMESDAFWDTYQDYVDRGGNSHIKSEVQPAMRNLTVIPMVDGEKVTELMRSRKG